MQKTSGPWRSGESSTIVAVALRHDAPEQPQLCLLMVSGMIVLLIDMNISEEEPCLCMVEARLLQALITC